MASSLRNSALTLITQYAAYHRDRRNVATHFVGIPLIVFGIVLWLSRPAFAVGDWQVTPALVLWVVSSVWYLTRGNWLLGVAVSAANGALVALAGLLADGSGAPTLMLLGAAFFIVGWVFQFVGHAYEGRKPAFVDDLVGLLVGPMFVCAEVLFAMGLCAPLRRQVAEVTAPSLQGTAHRHG